MTGEVDYLTVEEFAAKRRVHVQTIYAAIRRGLFQWPIERVGRSIRIIVPRESIQKRPASYQGSKELNDGSATGSRR